MKPIPFVLVVAMSFVSLAKASPDVKPTSKPAMSHKGQSTYALKDQEQVCPAGYSMHVVQKNKLEAGGVLATKVAELDEPLRMRMKDDVQGFVARSSAPAGAKICVRA